MKKQIQTLKGFRDFNAKDVYEREWLKSKLIEVFTKWGFEPLETPVLEPLEIFKGNIGEDEKLFYKFKDNGGRNVALRYDQTVPTCRYVAQNYANLIFPYKRYQMQMIYRAEKPQKGRYREVLMCDADIFGVKDVIADAEVIGLTLDIYRNIGIKDAKVLVNDRKLLKDIPYKALSSIDKVKKIGKEGVLDDMVSKDINLKDAKIYLKKVLSLKPSKDVEFIFNFLKNYGFDESMYAFDPTIIRSFSYSTGPIWEVVSESFSPKLSLLGGERYDELVEKISGKEIPGTGFGLGFDRTLEAARKLGLVPEYRGSSQIIVAALSERVLKRLLEVTMFLREQEFNTETYTEYNDKIEKIIKYALKKGVRNLAIIGDEELKKNKVLLKDLKENKQKLVTVTGIMKELS